MVEFTILAWLVVIAVAVLGVLYYLWAVSHLSVRLDADKADPALQGYFDSVRAGALVGGLSVVVFGNIALFSSLDVAWVLLILAIAMIIAATRFCQENLQPIIVAFREQEIAKVVSADS